MLKVFYVICDDTILMKHIGNPYPIDCVCIVGNKVHFFDSFDVTIQPTKQDIL